MVRPGFRLAMLRDVTFGLRHEEHDRQISDLIFAAVRCEKSFVLLEANQARTIKKIRINNIVYFFMLMFLLNGNHDVIWRGATKTKSTCIDAKKTRYRKIDFESRLTDRTRCETCLDAQ